MLKKKTMSLVLVISMLVSVFALFGVTANAVDTVEPMAVPAATLIQAEDELYSEVVVTRRMGATITINMTFATAGYRIIQTFGETSYHITYGTFKFYDAVSGSTIDLANEYAGYERGCLFYHYFESNLTYQITVRLNVSDTIRLSATHAHGLFSNESVLTDYDNIESFTIPPADESIVIQHTFYPGNSAIVLRGIPTEDCIKTVACDGQIFYIMDPTSKTLNGAPLTDGTSVMFTQGIPYYFIMHPGIGDDIDPITVTLAIG